MTQILRVTTRWSGFTGSPGYTVFHMRDFDTEGDVTPAQADAAIGRIRAFWQGITVHLPAAVSLQVLAEVDVVEDTTGQMVDAIATTVANAPIQGSGSGSVAGPAGAVINWRTSSIRNGRRIRGRTFIVPLSTANYETNGTLVASAISSFSNAANALIDGAGTPDLGVYARPTGPGATDGQWVRATGFTVPDMVAVLRSRRD